MMAFLYHRVAEGKRANPLAMMEEHLALFAGRTVLPGDPLDARSVCLTFDDAYFDFYHFIFPLLKKYHLRALLAVPVHYILEKTSLPPAVRLGVTYREAMQNDVHLSHAPFCTWEELSEMTSSGLVEIASHSMHHQSLLTPGLNLDLEIAGSKQLLEEKLHCPIRTFVYPLGQFNRTIHARVKRHYEFAMRIGSTWNTSWQNYSGMIYRILSDNLVSPDQHLRLTRQFSYAWFYLLNSLRGR